MDVTEASETCETIVDAVSAAVIAERSFLETVLLGVIARGHVLLEDAPGTGKTLTARSVATALGLSFSRIQFTPDLLPSDITGTHVYDERTGDFEFNRGPVFANVVIGAGESDVDEDVSPPPSPAKGTTGADLGTDPSENSTSNASTTAASTATCAIADGTRLSRSRNASSSAWRRVTVT